MIITKLTTLTLSVLMMVPILSGCTKTSHATGERALKDLRVAYEYGSNLYVITGRGRPVLTMRAKRAQRDDWKGQRKLEYGFVAPDVHPQQDRLIAVRWHEYDPNEYPHRGYCELIEISLRDRSAPVQVLYRPGGDMAIAAPTWSPDGHRIAFFEGPQHGSRFGEVVLFDRESSRVVRRTHIEQMHYVSPSNYNYLRWSVDGNRIFLWVTRSGDRGAWSDRDVGILTLASGAVRWLGRPVVREWPNGKLITREPRSEEELLNYEPQIVSPEDIEATQTLFGSIKGPIYGQSVPLWSPDRRYFFRYNHYYGIGAKGWIERCSSDNNQCNAIKTIWWAIYAE